MEEKDKSRRDDEVLESLAMPKGIQEGILEGGIEYVGLDFWADDAKDNPEYFTSIQVGMPIREFRREYLRDDSVYTGMPVYPEYQDSIHLRDVKFPVRPEYFTVCAWDTGDTLNHAVLIAQVEPRTRQVILVGEILDFNISLEVFAESVYYGLAEMFGASTPPGWIKHTGDPAIHARHGVTGEAVSSYLGRRFGFMLDTSAITNSFVIRHSAGAWLLNDVITDKETGVEPRVIFSVQNTPGLVEALRGGWQWEEVGIAGSSLAVKTRRRPRKDRFSHVGDAFTYLAMYLQKYLTGRPVQVRRRKISL